MEDRQTEDKIKFTAKEEPNKFSIHRCAVCNGFGTLKYGTITCRSCNGRGYVVINNETGYPVEERQTDKNERS